MAKKKRELYAETACLHCNQRGRENIKTGCKICGGSGWVRSSPIPRSPKKDSSSFVLVVGLVCIAWLMLHKDHEIGKKDLAVQEPPIKTEETQNKTAPSRGQDEKEPELKVLLRTLDRVFRD